MTEEKKPLLTRINIAFWIASGLVGFLAPHAYNQHSTITSLEAENDMRSEWIYTMIKAYCLEKASLPDWGGLDITDDGKVVGLWCYDNGNDRTYFSLENGSQLNAQSFFTKSGLNVEAESQ